MVDSHQEDSPVITQSLACQLPLPPSVASSSLSCQSSQPLLVWKVYRDHDEATSDLKIETALNFLFQNIFFPILALSVSFEALEL